MELTNQMLDLRALRPSRRTEWRLPYGNSAESSRLYDQHQQQRAAFEQRLATLEQANQRPAAQQALRPKTAEAGLAAPAVRPHSPATTSSSSPSLSGSPSSDTSSRFATPPASPRQEPVGKPPALPLQGGWPMVPFELCTAPAPATHAPLSPRHSGELTPTPFTRPPQLRDTPEASSHPSQRNADGQGSEYGSQTQP